MVMATGSVCQPYGRAASDLSREAGEAGEASDANEAGGEADAAALHDRLVAYVHALAGGQEPRSGVWVEHSYARARGAGSAQAAAHVRVLLAPRAPPTPDLLDVERVSPPPPSPPAPPARPDSDADEPDELDADDWEARVLTLAPSAAHARLADHALDALRRMRLARLAATDAFARHEAARAAARRLRLALAPACAQPARPAAWLHGALLAHMPRWARRLYDALTRELRRSAPRLAARLLGARAGARRAAAPGEGRALRGVAGPLLVWVGGGRWARRLGALVRTRVLPAEAAAPAAPEPWCAAVVASVRAALADVLAEAGDRGVILGGIGAGAALAAALANTPRVRALLLLAPPLLTLAGERDTPDDPLAEIRLPMLVVAGTGAAQCWRGAARELTRGEAGARRLLELRGADDALRLPAALRRRLPQHAIDAAVADECARWMIEIAENSNGEAPPRERVRRRGASPAIGGGRRAALELERSYAGTDGDEDEYAHLPSATCSRATEAEAELVAEFSGRRGGGVPSETSVALGAGRVVSRGPGGTPLALLPPRREQGPALAPADIMRLPVVFADDAAGVTVTAGRRARYTRVIVASRGRGGGAGAAGGGGAGGGGGGSGSAGARPVLLRRGVRLLRRVPRLDQPH